MKLALTLFFLFALAAASNPDDPADAVNIPVEVDVECPGVDFAKLSLPTAAFASKALQETYNKVQQDVDGGDSFLSKIHFDHAFKKKGKRPKFDSGLEEDGELVVGATRYWGSWMGNWGCRLCPYLLSSSDGIAVQAWEMAFVAAILESDHKQFDKVKTCTITIAPSPQGVATIKEEPVELSVKQVDDNEDEDDVVQMGVEVDAECDGIDYSKVTIEALGFASKALQDSYNEVQQDLNGGDSFLSKIHFDHVFKKKKKYQMQVATTELRGSAKPGDDEGALAWGTRYWGSWMGNWGCRLCPDNYVGFDVLGGSGIELRAWEAEFTAKMASSKHEEFANAKSCSIDIFSKEAVVTA